VRCEKVRTKLSAYLDREVDADVHREITGHLEQCLGCREDLKNLRGIDALLSTMPRYALSADFAKAVVARVQKPASAELKRSFVQRLWNGLLEHSEKFLELLDPELRIGTRSLDEFNDVPACFIGHAYFKVLGPQR